MWERIRQIMRKELRQTVRDVRRRALLFGPPLLQLIVFGYAVNLDVHTARIAWLDRDNTPESRALRAALESSHYFRVVAVPTRPSDVRELLDQGGAQAVVQVLPGFARDLMRGGVPAVQILVDGTNSNTAAIIMNYANQIVAAQAAAYLREASDRRLLGAGAAVPVAYVPASVTAQLRVWFNPDLKSRNYFVPGVVVNIIALVTIILTAMSIVREREAGTMEQLMVTPIRPVELMLGKILPFALIGLIEVAMIVAAALLVFGIPFRGSAAVLYACSVLFLLTSLGVGLFISTVSHTMQQAAMASFFFFMPALLLSGFAFPIRNMPPAVQYLTYLNPVRYFMEIVRGIFLKGTGVAVLWPQMLALLVLGITIFTLSSLRFHKRLD
ncbi:MAG: ABC transporter permease [Acidobacteria bacterium]|nr:ABC transporter permease [Acidobacteriota bacterium]